MDEAPELLARGCVREAPAVDCQDPVAWLEMRGCRRSGRDRAHGRVDVPKAQGEHEEDRERQQDVHGRPRRDDYDPLPDGLVVVRAWRDVRWKLLVRVHPGDLHEAAEGQGADSVLRLATPDAHELRRKEEEEALDPHAGCLGGDEVAELVDDDQYREAGDGERPTHRVAPTLPASSRARSRASASAA